MILIITIFAILCILSAFIILHRKKEYPLTLKLSHIKTYLSQELNLNENVLFLELIRQFTIDLISLSQKNCRYQKEIKEITHTLLGFILQIPRLEENSEQPMLLNAIQQIDSINQTTSKIKKYLNQKSKNLEIYLNEVKK